MTQSIAIAGDNTPVNDELLSSYLDAMGLATKLNQNEKAQFLQIAQAYGLNPFKREIYVTKYSDTFSIIVGYETYIKRAERTGLLNGWECEFHGEGDALSCVVTIYRKDWERPFRHEAWYEESVQKTNNRPTRFWEKRRHMTRKVAISQAFRLCFSDEIGGMPYTDDEMGVPVQEVPHEVMTDRTPAQQKVDAISQPIESAHEAKPIEPAKPKPTKQQVADASKALNAWHVALGELNNDPDRQQNPEAWQVAATALGAIAHLDREEKRKLFDGMVNLAFDHGVDYDRGKTNKFYLAEPETVANEEEVADVK